MWGRLESAALIDKVEDDEEEGGDKARRPRLIIIFGEPKIEFVPFHPFTPEYPVTPSSVIRRWTMFMCP